MSKKLLYLHDNVLNLKRANMHQVIAMCTEFSNYGLTVCLLVPWVKDAIWNRLKTELNQEYPINFEIGRYKDSRLERFLNYLGYSRIRDVQFDEFDYLYTRVPSLVPRVLKSNKRAKVFYEAHNYRVHHGNADLDKYWISWLKKLQHKYQYWLVCISENLGKYYADKGFTSNLILCEHDGYSFSDIVSREPKLIRDLRTSYSSVAVYAGSLNSDRGLEVIRRSANHFSDTAFIVIGGNSKEVVYYQSILSGPNFFFTGRIPHEDVNSYIGNADVLLGIWSSAIPTINYCSPLKLFEYMSVGKPIVIPRFPTMLEVLSEQEAFYYNPDSEEDFFKAFEQARLKVGDEALKNHLRDKASYYTWANRVKRIIEDSDS